MPVAAMHQLLATFLIPFLLSFLPSHTSASVLLDGRSTVGLNYVDIYETTGSSILTDPRPGYKAFVGLQAQVLNIGKRDCLSNGSNFCFGNNINFCSDCGNCCIEKQYCCGRGGVCCGTGCCSSDQVCSSDLKCVSPVSAVTVTSTIYQTSTHVEKADKTIVIVEVGTSTVLSTVETTISNAATQTNVDWVTATITAGPTPAKRQHNNYRIPPLNPKRSLLNSLFSRGLELLDHGPVLHRKEAITTAPAAPSGAGGSGSTITKYVTQISVVTDIDVKSVTRTTTTYVTTTIFETVTRVLNAQTTILVTSTLTITSHAPTTKVIYTAANTLPRDGSPNPSSTSSPTATPIPAGAQSLPIPAIAGIAVGTAAAAILLLTAIIFLIRRRRRRLREPSFDMAHPPRTPDHMQTRQPTIPRILPHFVPSAPAHHAAPRDLPKGFVFGGEVGVAVSPPGTAIRTPPPAASHHRSSSGLSTLIGTPALGGGGAGGKGDRRSGFSMGSGATLETTTPAAAVEVQGSQVPEWFEADGNPVVGGGGPRGGSPVEGLGLGRGSPRPQAHRQGASFYYQFPSTGQRMDGGEEVEGRERENGSGNGSPLRLTVSRSTIGSPSPGELGAIREQGQQLGQQGGGYDGGQQQQYEAHQQNQQTYYYPGS